MDKMETENKTENNKKLELKHLGFVRLAAIQALVCVSNLYEYARKNSGPLRSTVGTVEGAVTTVVGPVHRKFKGVPDDLLVFLDHKVDEAAHKFDKHAPRLAKQVVGQAQVLMYKASKKAQKLINEARTGGPRAAVHCAAAETKEFVLTNSVTLWVKLDKYPTIHSVAETAVPTAAHWSEKYNHVVMDMSQKGYAVFNYVPLIPIDEIAKAFKQGEAKKKGEELKSSSDSD